MNGNLGGGEGLTEIGSRGWVCGTGSRGEWAGGGWGVGGGVTLWVLGVVGADWSQCRTQDTAFDTWSPL